jgi:hypothetical protein
MSEKTTKAKTLTGEEFDRLADSGKDMSEYLDFAHATRPGRDFEGVKLAVPTEVLQRIDREAEKRHVSRETLMLDWLYEKLAEQD